MKVELCPDTGPFDFRSSCVRLAWSTLLPAVFVFLLCICGSVIPALFTKVLIPIDYERYPGWFKTPVGAIRNLFSNFLTLEEAEELLNRDTEKDEEHDASTNGIGSENDKTLLNDSDIYFRRTIALAGLGLAETIAWLAYGSYQLVALASSEDGNWDSDTEGDSDRGRLSRWLVLAAPFLLALTWLYTVLRAALRRASSSSTISQNGLGASEKPKLPLTPPYDLFVLYCLQFIAATVQLGGVVWDWVIYREQTGLGIVLAFCINFVVVVALLGVVLAMPLAVPSERINRNDIGKSVSPEDYSSLFGWITFHWVAPLIRRGRNTTLNEKDVWKLSPTMQSRPVFAQFAKTNPTATLLKRLWVANSLDIILDFVITIVSVVFNYAGPFFLKRILDSIAESPTAEGKGIACIYAFFAFLCSMAKGQADLQHLWINRRAATRIRSELMASIYDKALKRKDFSGLVDKDRAMSGAQPDAAAAPGPEDKKAKKKSKKDKKKDKKEKDTKDEPKAGADVGKIVNLMAGDANRISATISAMYFIYGAPFEIIIASIFLYQLLGWSAFAGFIVLLLGWPLNSLIARRSIRIQKGVLAARDKRMGVLNELIGAVKFIKFFAWEDRWIERAMDAREAEMKWMVKARVNSVLFGALWVCAPIFISVISFAVYVLQGNQLTVSIAFTSIALFNMVRAPLNVIPTWIVQILQTGVALDRIAVYLSEDEVSEQVSSLKTDGASPSLATTSTTKSVLGILNASFKWNEIEETKDEADSSKGKGKAKDASRSASPSGDDSSTVVSIDVEAGVAADAETSSLLTENNDHKFELRDISIMFPEGELTVITGPTASGKTALLMALLGEMTLLPNADGTEGCIIMSKNPLQYDENGLSHSLSYAAQSPWLRHQSIKDNILFGYPYDEERYQAVVEACALKPDLEMLEDGDETEIGARGVSLSGGQKARVALARAVYARTKYVLLDDPLSAVDSHTSRFLYEKLLRGPLLANRTVVLVTHHVELVLPGANYLVRMLDGRIDTHGTVKELQDQGVLETIAHDAEVEAKKEELLVAAEAEVQDPDPLGDVPEERKKESAKKPRKLVKDEHRETGSVKWNIYKSYLKASSYWIWAFLGFLIVLVQVWGLSEKIWIMIWGEAYGEPSTDQFITSSFRTFGGPSHGDMPMDGYVAAVDHNPSTAHAFFSLRKRGTFGVNWPDAVEHPLFYVGVYAAIGFLNAFTNLSSTIAQYTGALRASRIMFKQLLVTVVRATFRFHDTTPQGRMLNRFGKDIEIIDSSLAGSLQAVNTSLASFLASIIAVAFVFPAFLVPAIIIGLGYRELAIGYLNTGRDLRRMESNSRSPIFSDFGELLEGIVTVRAFSAERRFLDNLHRKIDLTTQMWYSFWMTNRWLLLNFDFLGAAAVFITTLFAIATLSGGAGLAGLCITSAMSFTSSVYWACRFWTALELDLNSVERIVEYLDLPQEPPAVIESNRVPAYWPSTTTDSLVVVEDLEIKYAPDLPAVLHNVSFSLRPGERVGLLGRTGSGKSTLAMSLLRFVDPTKGRIMIDGIDISKIGIQDLRSRLTFIPQDATLFSGTLRDNLDPFNEHTDAECLDVLRRVHMVTPTPSGSRPQSAVPSRAASVHNLDISDAASIATTATDVESRTTVSLDTQVSAGGSNFSQGQRQLVAMARALLRRSSVIILDEATSSIDFATDAKIQTTIREEFNNSLLLTVAHRLRTVIDYDRLIVLDKGEIVEFDSPWNLIQKEDGIFRTMCLKSGTFSELESAARSKAEAAGVL